MRLFFRTVISPNRSSPSASSGARILSPGGPLADKIIISAQFGFTPDISMPNAAAVTINTAALYSNSAKKAVTAAFAARGLA